MSTELNQSITEALEDLKGQNIVTLDVSSLTDVTDHLVIVNGTSNRHVKSLASNVVEKLKGGGHKAIGVEGMDAGEWVLVDYGDTVVHVMLPAMREFYELEKLWSKVPAHRNQDASSSDEE